MFYIIIAIAFLWMFSTDVYIRDFVGDIMDSDLFYPCAFLMILIGLGV